METGFTKNQSCARIIFVESESQALRVSVGIPYFCDWKPGLFRTTSLIRWMCFISDLE